MVKGKKRTKIKRLSYKNKKAKTGETGIRKGGSKRKEKQETVISHKKDKQDLAAGLTHDKRLIMWSGISFFMVLILLFWFLNIKNVFRNIKDSSSPSQFSWSEISDEFDKTMKQIKQGVDELKQLGMIANTSTSTPPEIDQSTQDEDVELNETDIIKLKDKLKRLEEELN